MPKINIPLTVPKAKEEEFKKNYSLATRNTNRLMMFAADQKVEHLNNDFVGPNIPAEVADPEHYFKIASQAHIGVMATQLGLIAHYGRAYPNIPYLVKINSKTNILPTKYKDPFANIWLELEDIIKFKQESGLNIVGVGYTVYIGSWYESNMFNQAASLVYQAHQEGLITVLWMYPRGRAVKNETDLHLIAGGAGVALCLGADFVKVNYPYDSPDHRQTIEKFKEVVTAAGRTGVICVGGARKDPKIFLDCLSDQIKLAGGRGNATGRNIYQRPLDQAIRMANAISAISLYDYPAEKAYEIFLGKKELQIPQKADKTS